MVGKKDGFPPCRQIADRGVRQRASAKSMDEKALFRALQDGQIAAAGLDVLEAEPTPEENPLFDLDNVVITPHMAGQSQETNLRAASFAYGNIMRALAGDQPESLVTPE